LTSAVRSNLKRKIMETAITFKRTDGKEAKGHLANTAHSDAPGIVVIQEWWGLQDQIRGMCDRFAAAGFDALAPDLYNGIVVPYHDTTPPTRKCPQSTSWMRPSRRFGGPHHI
jgi:carboxymethylenebutenolidase